MLPEKHLLSFVLQLPDPFRQHFSGGKCNAAQTSVASHASIQALRYVTYPQRAMTLWHCMCRVKFFRRSNIKKSNSFYKIYSLLYFLVVDKQNKHTAAQILWQSA